MLGWRLRKLYVVIPCDLRHMRMLSQLAGCRLCFRLASNTDYAIQTPNRLLLPEPTMQQRIAQAKLGQ